MKKCLSYFINGILAGTLILLGSMVFSLTYKEGEINIIGSILFSVALLTICLRGYNLYTGKIGYIIINHKKEDIKELLIGLIGNIISTVLLSLLVSYIIGDKINILRLIANNKLNKEWWKILIFGVLCGILIYVAVAIYKEKGSVIGILFAIPTFILIGAEHSIADIAYFSMARIFSFKSVLYIVLIIIGNSIGSLMVSSLECIIKKINNKE